MLLYISLGLVLVGILSYIFNDQIVSFFHGWKYSTGSLSSEQFQDYLKIRALITAGVGVLLFMFYLITLF